MKRYVGWLIYAAFAIVAIANAWNAETLEFSGTAGVGKGLIWLALLGFLVFSVYCSRHENIFKTIGVMSRLHWGRQIGLDLYIGLALFMVFILLHQGSVLVALLWLVPVLLFANLATLLYLAIHFESIVAMFVS